MLFIWFCIFLLMNICTIETFLSFSLWRLTVNAFLITSQRIKLRISKYFLKRNYTGDCNERSCVHHIKLKQVSYICLQWNKKFNQLMSSICLLNHTNPSQTVLSNNNKIFDWLDSTRYNKIATTRFDGACRRFCFVYRQTRYSLHR